MTEDLSARRKRAWITRREQYGDSGHDPRAYSTLLGKPTARALAREDIDPAKEIELLRQVVVTYGDRVRMASAANPALQQVIDRAFQGGE